MANDDDGGRVGRDHTHAARIAKPRPRAAAIAVNQIGVKNGRR